MRTIFGTVTPLLFVLTACAADPAPTPPVVDGTRQGLTIGQHDATRIDGVFVQGTARVVFAATMVEDTRADVSIAIGKQAIHVDIDYAAGAADYDAQGLVFTAEELALVEAAGLALEEYMPTQDVRLKVEDALTQQVALLAIAPADIALDRFEIIQDRSVYCIYCTCQNQYIGSGYYRQAGRGNSCTGGSGNGCKGRCGVGCSGDLSGNYTQDCAKHDYGLVSWTAASDDYTFGGCWCG